MTYFTFKQTRGTRGEQVYLGSSLLGRVAAQTDWRSRLTLAKKPKMYCAMGLGGELVPGTFLSRHDAAEALYGLVCGGATAIDDMVNGPA
jgi:hypothetical protein